MSVSEKRALELPAVRKLLNGAGGEPTGFFVEKPGPLASDGSSVRPLAK